MQKQRLHHCFCTFWKSEAGVEGGASYLLSIHNTWGWTGELQLISPKWVLPGAGENHERVSERVNLHQLTDLMVPQHNVPNFISGFYSMFKLKHPSLKTASWCCCRTSHQHWWFATQNRQLDSKINGNMKLARLHVVWLLLFFLFFFFWSPQAPLLLILPDPDCDSDSGLILIWFWCDLILTDWFRKYSTRHSLFSFIPHQVPVLVCITLRCS